MRKRPPLSPNLKRAAELIELELLRLHGKRRHALRSVLRALWSVADRMQKILGDEQS